MDMDVVFIVVLVIFGISFAVTLVKEIFGFIGEHIVGCVGVLFGIVGVLVVWGLLAEWFESTNSEEGQRRRRLVALEAQYAQELQVLEKRRDSLLQEFWASGAQVDVPLCKVETFPSWKEAAQRRDSRVTEAEYRQMFLKYLYKQAELLQTGSASWPGLAVRIRELQEEANALLSEEASP